jgi:hypothetical protein
VHRGKCERIHCREHFVAPCPLGRQAHSLFLATWQRPWQKSRRRADNTEWCAGRPDSRTLENWAKKRSSAEAPSADSC